MKRKLPLGHRLALYVAVRARKPALIVETGIYRGLGSWSCCARSSNRQ